jgi:hypothetical protein
MEHWKVSSSDFGIVITCRGHDKVVTVRASVADFDALATEHVGTFTIIADLREMTGYQTESRQAWQTAFAKHRDKVQGLILVGAKSPLIRMGAAAVGAYAGIPVRFVATWSEVARASVVKN